LASSQAGKSKKILAKHQHRNRSQMEFSTRKFVWSARIIWQWTVDSGVQELSGSGQWTVDSGVQELSGSAVLHI